MTHLSVVRVSVLVLLTLPHFAQAQNAEEIKIGGTFDVEVVRDVTYHDGKETDSNKHKLDLYLPKGHKDFPVLFFIHGGAWTVGSRWEHGLAGRMFARNGVGMVLISYRLSPQVQHPGHIEDVARAFAWTHHNIGKYGGRADEIFVSGQSAGGHLAALLATNEEYLKEVKLSLKDIKGVMPISGVYSFQHGELEWVIGKGKEAAESASPLKHMSGKEPPFLIMYAEKEVHRIDKMSKELFAALQKENVQAECVEIKDRNHISLMFWLMLSEADPATQALLKFLSKHSSLKLTPRERGEQNDERKSGPSATMRADPKDTVDRVAVPCLPIPIPTQPAEVVAAAPTQQGVIVAASDANNAAQRLKTLITQDSGLKFAVVRPSQKHDGGELQFVLCTKASRSEVKHLLPAAALSADLRPQGFLISTDAQSTQAVVIGGDMDGLRYGVGEFWNYHCALDGMRIVPQSSVSLVKAPAFSKRMFWNWTHCTNWDDDLNRVHQTKHVDANGTLEPYLAQPSGFADTFQKIVDFQADHKLNGLIVWGFINDAHGGLATAQSVSRYAKANGVKILPGIGTMGYGGFYFGGDHPFNINTFLAKHQQVRLMVQADGKDMPGTPCPSDPVFQQWLRDGAEWYFSTLKDIGGVNLEHGDFFQCHCPRCKSQRSLLENDQNYHWDMMATQVPVIERGLKINPELWYSYACYDAYNAALMSNPPKFLAQYPKAAITQWTYTKMIADPILNPAGSWPLSLRPPAGTNHSIGLLHQGSHWDVKRQWWGESAKSDVAFGGTYSLVSDLIQQACHRAIADQSEGLQIIGQIGAASPQNELNYLALEAFSWNPQLDYQTWIDRELAPLYGGPKLSRRYYELVSSITKQPQDIASDLREAQQHHAKIADPRQARRWANLISELRRRQALTQ